MLKTGAEHLESLRDGRVSLGRERIDDVTRHPAFKNTANTIAALYDHKALPENRDLMTFEEDGSRYSMWYLMPKSQEDLEKRRQAHERIADLTTECSGAPWTTSRLRDGHGNDAAGLRGGRRGPW